jgi:hypothetical protein
MLQQTLNLKSRLTASVSAVLFCWLLLNTSTIALAEKRRDNWGRQPRTVARRATCGPAYDSARGDRSYERYRVYDRNRNYGRARDYDRYSAYDRDYYDRDRDYDRRYRAYDRDRNYNRYRGYERERSKTKSALIIAGSSGAGAATGAIVAGGKGAAIGAIAGGVAGLIYDRQTDNRR